MKRIITLLTLFVISITPVFAIKIGLYTDMSSVKVSASEEDQMIDVKVGDDLDSLMNAEILLEDGKIVAFRK